MLADAERGRFDILIVHKLDRFSRNLRPTLKTLERHGVGFVSLAEQMDFATPMGRVVLSAMGSLSQFYSDNLSWERETTKGKLERKRQGKRNGLLPFGVATNARGVPGLDADARCCDVATRQEVVPSRGLVLVFELAAAGKTDRDVAQALNRAGYRTAATAVPTPSRRTPCASSGGTASTSANCPTVAADSPGGTAPSSTRGSSPGPRRRARNTRRPRRVAGLRSPWALSGVAVCGGCGRPITVEGKRRARCSGRTQGNGCDEPSFAAELVEAQIGELLADFAAPAAEQARLGNAWRRQQSAAVDTAAARLGIRRQLERLKEAYLERELDKAEYHERKATLADELGALPAEGDPGPAVGARLAAYLADVADAWRAATAEERNKLVRQLFNSAAVSNRTAVAMVPRPSCVPSSPSSRSSDHAMAEATGIACAR